MAQREGGEDGADGSGAMLRAMRRSLESASSKRREANVAVTDLEAKASGVE